MAGVKAYAAGFPLSTVYSRAGNVCVTLVTPSDGDVTVPLVAGETVEENTFRSRLRRILALWSAGF